MDGTERGGKEGRRKGGRREFFSPAKKYNGEKGTLSHLCPLQTQRGKGTLFLMDRLAKFASYVAAAQVEARLVGDSLDSVPTGRCHGRCSRGPDPPSIGWGGPSKKAVCRGSTPQWSCSPGMASLPPRRHSQPSCHAGLKTLESLESPRAFRLNSGSWQLSLNPAFSLDGEEE